jgi:hypothetical protein
MRRILKILAALVTSWLMLNLCTPASAIEPEHKLGNWIGATSTLRYSDKWSLFLQGEVRTWEPAHNLNEVLWRFAGHSIDFVKESEP